MKGLLSKTKSFLKRSSPTILTCFSVAGVVGTTVLAVKATPKAVELIKNDSRRNHDGDPYAYTKLEAVQSCWRCYIPVALVGLSTITCIIGINVLNKRNQASLASAYALLSESYQQYRKAAKTVYGDDADSKIKVQMAKDTYISAYGYIDSYSVYYPDLDSESEKILCYDLFSQRYFMSTMAAVLNAQYHINRNLILRGNASINEFYEFLGIDKIENGDDMGWDMNEFIEEGIVWLDFDNRHTVMDDELECCVISCSLNPNKFTFET